MTDLNDRRVAKEIIAAAERMARRTIGRMIAVTRYGVVAGDGDPASRTATVRLYGQSELSGGFTYGTEQPRDGDRVRVLIDPRGDRYVAAILGRDALPPAEPVASLPAASSALRGRFRLVVGDPGVADAVYVCVKLADDSYAWASVA